MEVFQIQTRMPRSTNNKMVRIWTAKQEGAGSTLFPAARRTGNKTWCRGERAERKGEQGKRRHKGASTQPPASAPAFASHNRTRNSPRPSLCFVRCLENSAQRDKQRADLPMRGGNNGSILWGDILPNRPTAMNGCE